jgi:hypothetical protein
LPQVVAGREKRYSLLAGPTPRPIPPRPEVVPTVPVVSPPLEARLCDSCGSQGPVSREQYTTYVVVSFPRQVNWLQREIGRRATKE